MKCPSCSSDIPDDAEFCAFCGEPVRRCGNCSRVYSADVSFCGHCGTTLDLSSNRAFRGTGGPPKGRSKAIYQTAPGRPGPKAPDGQPTFVLPTDSDERDPRIYGYIFDPDEPSHRFELHRGDNTLGAGHNNDIVVDAPAVSWNHALLICRNHKVFLQDSASTNGTYVDGDRIERPKQLANGARVRFGNIRFDVWLKTDYR